MRVTPFAIFRRCSQRLTAIIQRITDPWLLLGDFNMPAALWLGAHPFLRAYPTPAKPTYPTKNPVEPIDSCVAPQTLSVQGEVLPEVGSDHLPILVSCRLG